LTLLLFQSVLDSPKRHGIVTVLARCSDGVVSVMLRWNFDGSSKDLGPFCPPGRPSGASEQRPPKQPRPGFDSIGLAAFQRNSHFPAASILSGYSVTLSAIRPWPSRLSSFQPHRAGKYDDNIGFAPVASLGDFPLRSPARQAENRVKNPGASSGALTV
jgi:hypothetical protein